MSTLTVFEEGQEHMYLHLTSKKRNIDREVPIISILDNNFHHMTLDL